MAHFFMIPTNENGLIIDGDILTSDLPVALNQPFSFSEAFLYSHGWATDAASAMQMYNKFGIAFAKTLLEGVAKAAQMPSYLAAGLHWPSMISEDSNALVNHFEALSFYTMEKRADIVGAHAGYSLLRTLLEQGKGIKSINLIGHSFGCKVVLSTLQEIANDGNVDTPVNVILLQAACDDESLQVGDDYGKVITNFSNLRLFMTISSQDEALNKWYPLAGEINIFHRDTRKALGATGPGIAVGALFKGDIGQLSIDNDFNANDQANVTALKHKFVIADLSLIHQYRRNNPPPPNGPLYKADPFAGSHSDIFFNQLYSAIAKFLY